MPQFIALLRGINFGKANSAVQPFVVNAYLRTRSIQPGIPHATAEIANPTSTCVLLLASWYYVINRDMPPLPSIYKQLSRTKDFLWKSDSSS